jgi:nucleoside permease NupC
MFSCFGLSSISGGLITGYVLKNGYDYCVVFQIASGMNAMAILILCSYANLQEEKSDEA